LKGPKLSCQTNSSFEQHLIDIAEVLQRLIAYNLKLKARKCSFGCKEAEYLGHIINKEGIRPNNYNLNKIKNYPVPKTVEQVHSFLGLAGYYRSSVKRFDKIARSLRKKL
jgi:hypothetical protein